MGTTHVVTGDGDSMQQTGQGRGQGHIVWGGDGDKLLSTCHSLMHCILSPYLFKTVHSEIVLWEALDDYSEGF